MVEFTQQRETSNISLVKWINFEFLGHGTLLSTKRVEYMLREGVTTVINSQLNPLIQLY